jgi:hypothetical protein
MVLLQHHRISKQPQPTKWLIEENIREKMDKRPGSYLRSKCRSGRILGAEKKGQKLDN